MGRCPVTHIRVCPGIGNGATAKISRSSHRWGDYCFNQTGTTQAIGDDKICRTRRYVSALYRSTLRRIDKGRLRYRRSGNGAIMRRRSVTDICVCPGIGDSTPAQIRRTRHSWCD